MPTDGAPIANQSRFWVTNLTAFSRARPQKPSSKNGYRTSMELPAFSMYPSFPPSHPWIKFEWPKVTPRLGYSRSRSASGKNMHRRSALLLSEPYACTSTNSNLPNTLLYLLMTNQRTLQMILPLHYSLPHPFNSPSAPPTPPSSNR